MYDTSSFGFVVLILITLITSAPLLTALATGHKYHYLMIDEEAST